jgi:hypothetical protein
MTNRVVLPPWPWPGDSREDKARRIALSYRELVFEISQGRCDDPAGALHRIDAHWSQLGVHWHLPSRPDMLTEPDEWMSAPDVAHAIDRTRKDIYNWASRGHIQQRCGPDGTPEYLVGSVINYAKTLRARRAGTRP